MTQTSHSTCFVAITEKLVNLKRIRPRILQKKIWQSLGFS